VLSADDAVHDDRSVQGGQKLRVERFVTIMTGLRSLPAKVAGKLRRSRQGSSA
jgi:hypothetical protein